VQGGLGAVPVDGGYGDDSIYGNAAASAGDPNGTGATAAIQDGADELYGEDGNDTIYGNRGVDFIFAGVGNNTLHGGFGAERLQGGTGDDTLHIDDGNDSFVFAFEPVAPGSIDAALLGHDTIMDFDSDAVGGQDLID
jgi:Ca2+-binding RTX toxin-like protein